MLFSNFYFYRLHLQGMSQSVFKFLKPHPKVGSKFLDKTHIYLRFISEVRVTQSLVLYVCFVDRCLYFFF